MMEPRPRSLINGAACLMARKGPMGLTGGRRRGAGAGAEARYRGGADDGAAPSFTHQGRGVRDGAEGADEVDAEDFLPVLRRLLEDRGEAAGDAGIGEHNVEAAEAGGGAADEVGDVLLLAGVAAHGDGGGADTGGGFLHGFGGVGEDEVGAFPGEQLGGGAAEAGARAGDDGAFVGAALGP